MGSSMGSMRYREKTARTEDSSTEQHRGTRTRRKTYKNTRIKLAMCFTICALLVTSQISGSLPGTFAFAEDTLNQAVEQPAAEQPAAAQEPIPDETTEPPGNSGTSPGEGSDGEVALDTVDSTEQEDPPEDTNAEASEPSEEEIAPLSEELGALSTEITTQEELEAALVAATGSGSANVVTLTQNIELTRQLTIPANWSGVLSGGGFSLTLAPGYTGRHLTYTVAGSGYLRLENISFNGGGVGGGVALSGGSALPTVEVASSSFVNCSAAGANGGGLSLGAVTARISSSTFSGNTAACGGGLYLGATYYATRMSALEDCTFNGNTSTAAGGALYTSVSDPYIISNTVFTLNSSKTGGAIYAPSGSNITINGGRFAQNTATGLSGGGAIFTTGHQGVAPSYLTITGVTFEYNRAIADGGALYNNNETAKFTIANCNFFRNTAQGEGGAIYEGIMEITNTTFTGNEAGTSGGAIHSLVQGMGPAPLYGAPHLIIQGGSFTKNSATQFGGALCALLSESRGVKINGASFSNNWAGYGYLCLDYDNPIDKTPAADANGRTHDGASAYYAYQTLGGERYATNFTHIASVSLAPDGYPSSNNIINNFDVSDTSSWIVMMEKGTDASWAGPMVASTSSVAYVQNQRYSRTLDYYLGAFSGIVQRDGYVLVGFANDNNQVTGWESEHITKDGYRIIDPKAFLRGYLYLKPVWGEEVTLTYHLDSTISAGDPNGPFYKNQSGLAVLGLTDVDETWTAPGEEGFIGWGLTPEPVEGEELLAPGAALVAAESLNLYARWTVTPPPPTPTYTVTYLPGTHGTFGAQSTTTLLSGSPTPAAPYITGQEGWQFVGWYPAVSSVVTGNATYTAQWQQVIQPLDTFTVTFVDWNGTALKTEQVTRGGSATPPANPTRVGYTFDGWRGSYTNVNTDLTITALYLINTPTTTTTTTPPPASVDPVDPAERDIVEILRDDLHVPSFTIGGSEIPLSAGPYSYLVWALLNLVLALIGGVLLIITTVFALGKKARGNTLFTKRSGIVGLVIAAVMAVAGVVLFLVTQDMSLPLTITDDWTLLNAGILIVEIAGMVFVFRGAKSKKSTEDELRNQFNTGEMV